ncbi:hypothetical protein LTR05_008732 [Lithohypha guttulata]|uniref:Uncharacterized protein n=1 Tax=Lithohypha guttulata TaxID=1690604 RepID=A0AAN7PHA6_9EURO|nr:hypothetical protein LTR05_008732 [Lithohypha guttulata]
MAVMLEQGHISLLSLCQRPKVQRHLPSWAVDWSRPATDMLQDVENDHVTLCPAFAASTDTDVRPNIAVERRGGKVTGIMLSCKLYDKIKAVGSFENRELTNEVPLNETFSWPARWLLEILRLSYLYEEDGDFCARLAATTRTSIGGVGYDPNGQLIRIGDTRFFEAVTLLKCSIRLIKHRRMRLDAQRFLTALTTEENAACKTLVKSRLNSEIIGKSLGRLPFVTEKRHPAVARCSTLPQLTPATDDVDHQKERSFRAKRAPGKQVRVWKEMAEDATAKFGWLQARHAKDIQALNTTLKHRNRKQSRLEAELIALRHQISRLEAENAKRGDENKKLQAQLQQHDQTLERLRQFETEVRHTLLQIDTGRSLSFMEAAVHNEVPSEDLLQRVRGCWAGIEKSRARMNQIHRKKVMAMRQAVQAEKERFDELSHTLDHKTIGTSRASCGHEGRQAVAVTGCKRLLCEECYGEARQELRSQWIITQCSYCRIACPLSPVLEELMDAHRPANVRC